MSHEQENTLPQEICDMENAFKSVPGIIQVEISKHFYSQDDVRTLESIHFSGEYADLPIATLRRSCGNLDKELLICVEFTIEQNFQGLKALEFLSWWVRDLSRSGDNVQIRSLGLPPIVGEKIQLGSTLRFWFEAYIVTEREEIGLVLEKISEMARYLKGSLQLYKPAFQNS